MKPILLILLFSFVSANAHGQAIFALAGGIGQSTSSQTRLDRNAPTFSADYLQTVKTHVYIGCSLFYEHYSFINNPDGYNTGETDWVKQESGYLFFTPKVDIGFGKEQNFHLFFSSGPGVLLSGSQATSSYSMINYNSSNYYNYPPVYDTINTSNHINKWVFRISAGVTEYIHLPGGWDILLSEQFGFMPSFFSKDTNEQNTTVPFPGFRTDYLSVQLGIAKHTVKKKTIAKAVK